MLARRSGAGLYCFKAVVTLEQFSSAGQSFAVRIASLPEYQTYLVIRHSGESRRCIRKSGKRGAIIVPASLRKRFGIEEGSLVTAEEKDDGILIRPAVIVAVERYRPERKAEFLPFQRHRRLRLPQGAKSVRKLGLDPDSIPHRRPA